MATIKISNRFNDGESLFPEEESLLNELTEQDLTALVGGIGDDHKDTPLPGAEGSIHKPSSTKTTTTTDSNKPTKKDSSEEDGSAEEAGTLSGRYCGRVGFEVVGGQTISDGDR